MQGRVTSESWLAARSTYLISLRPMVEQLGFPRARPTTICVDEQPLARMMITILNVPTSRSHQAVHSIHAIKERNDVFLSHSMTLLYVLMSLPGVVLDTQRRVDCTRKAWNVAGLDSYKPYMHQLAPNNARGHKRLGIGVDAKSLALGGWANALAQRETGIAVSSLRAYRSQTGANS